MKDLKHVNEDFMDHQKTTGDADRVAAPVEVEKRRSAAPKEGRKKDRERGQLGEDIREEKLELPKQTTAKHEKCNPRLQEGVHDPKRIVQELYFVAHASCRTANACLHWQNPFTSEGLRGRRRRRARLAAGNPMFNAL